MLSAVASPCDCLLEAATSPLIFLLSSPSRDEMEGYDASEACFSNGFGSSSSSYQQARRNRHCSSGAVGFDSESTQPHPRDHSYEGFLTELDLYNKMCNMSIRDDFPIGGRSLGGSSSSSCKGGNFPDIINSRPFSDDNMMYNRLLELRSGREIDDSMRPMLPGQYPLINTYTAFGPYVNASGICSVSSSNNMLPSHYTDLLKMREAQEMQRMSGSIESSVFRNFPASVAETRGHILAMAVEQDQCRFLQKAVEEGNRRDVQLIFDEIIGNIVELMRNQFANYLIQKLLDVCSEEQRMKIVLSLIRDPDWMVRTCFDSHGTRVVQKLITTLRTKEQIASIADALQPVFLELVNDMNGNHVIKRCVECFSIDDNKFFFDSASKYCLQIATEQHGCCVLQHCIANSSGKQRERLIAEITFHALHLAQDPFGNYVIQYIIDMKTPYAISSLMARFEGNYVYLSLQKFSSHVVEKCIKDLEESRPVIVREILSVPRFGQLLQDPYANYVILSALTHTKGQIRAALVSTIMRHGFLRTSPYCKKIFSHKLLRNTN